MGDARQGRSDERLDSVETLRRVAVHVVARARQHATGRFSLRVTPGGFGTPEFGVDQRRVRIAGRSLIVESDKPGAASATSRPINGSTLSELATLAGVDLSQPLDVGRDTPPLGDIEVPIVLEEAAAVAVAEWFGVVAEALDRVLVDLPTPAIPTLPRLWPEHFDVAVEAQASEAIRVNLGGSPGDGFIAEPYLYVGPWTGDRPGNPAFWNAPFGAMRTRSELDSADPAGSAAAFLLEGVRRLTPAA